MKIVHYSRRINKPVRPKPTPFRRFFCWLRGCEWDELTGCWHPTKHTAIGHCWRCGRAQIFQNVKQAPFAMRNAGSAN